jgi:hypothetical protein
MIYLEYNTCCRAFDIIIKGPPGTVDPPTKVQVDEHDAQQLLQVLWNAGLRSEGRKAEMAAVKLHLQDMRRLVFDGKP